MVFSSRTNCDIDKTPKLTIFRYKIQLLQVRNILLNVIVQARELSGIIFLYFRRLSLMMSRERDGYCLRGTQTPSSCYDKLFYTLFILLCVFSML